MNIIVKVYLKMKRVPPDCHVFSPISSCHGVKQRKSVETRMLGTPTGSYVDHQVVSRCSTRGESWGMYIMFTSAKCE